MRQYVTYLRVSTTKQGIDGNGIEAQRAAAASFEGDHLAEYVEVESGRKSIRPELNNAIDHCMRTGATLVVAKLDRLSRNASFLLSLRDAGVDIHFCDMPDANKLTVGIMALVAEDEAERISARTKAALAVVKSRGTQLGNPNAAEAAAAARAARTASAEQYAGTVISIIDRVRSQGADTMRAIAQELTERRVETPARQAKINAGKTVYGAPTWHPQQVKTIIDRAA